MKIIIISDIHDNIENLNKCFDYCKKNKIKILFCCGDVAKNETIDYMANNFKGPIHLVRGNMCMFDNNLILNYNNIKYYGELARFQLDKYWIGLCHEPYKINKVLELGECDYIFYGHTHKPWEEVKGNTKIINPGTLNGIYKTSTFAVWDIDKNEVELKLIEQI